MRDTKARGSADEIRQALKARYPLVPFRVYSSRGRGVTVYWTDGPTEASVRRAVMRARGALAVQMSRAYSEALIRRAIQEVKKRHHIRARYTPKDYTTGRLLSVVLPGRKTWSQAASVQQQVGRTLARLH